MAFVTYRTMHGRYGPGVHTCLPCGRWHQRPATVLCSLIRNAANLTWFVVYPRIYSVDAKLCTLAVSGGRGDRVSGSVNVERVGQRAHRRPVSARRL